MQGEAPPDKGDARLVSLIFETVFSPRSWQGLTERNGGAVDTEPLSENLDHVLPFLQSALTAAGERAADSRSLVPQPTLLRELPLPICVVDTDLRLLSATSRALSAIDEGDFFSVREGHLIASNGVSQTVLTNRLQTSITERTGQVFRLSTGDREETFLAAPIPWRSADRPTAALFLDLQQGLFDRLCSRLAFNYGLTRSEADVAGLLARGMSIDEIADHKSVSQHTVRSQLKTVYGKTGTSRQAELVALVLSGPELLAGIAGGAIDNHSASTSAPLLLQLEDGRVMSYGDYGPRDGTPVLMCHHLLGSRFDCPGDLTLLDDLKVRLLVPERPGYGQSSAVAQRSLADWASDVRQLVDHLQIPSFTVLGFSSGGPHGAACAAFMPERVRRLGLVASLMPLDEVQGDVSAGLVERFATTLARRWPSAFTKMLTFRYARMLASPEESVSGFENHGNAADIDLLAKPQFNDIREQNVRRCCDLNPATFARELTMLFQPWGFSLADLELPVLVWHGRQDDFFPASHAEAAARWLPQCRADIREDWGHFFIYEHWREVLTDLTA